MAKANADKGYRIVELQVNNFLRIGAAGVTIRPDGSLVEITGKNAAGKSSVLDAIWCALAGEKAVPIEPIHQGAEKATIRLDLGDISIVRTFARTDAGKTTTKLRVEHAELGSVAAAQTLLTSLLGSLTFDPLVFERAKPEDQFETLKKFVAGFDFDADAKARQKDYDARTDANRRAKDFRSQAAGIVVPEGVPVEPVDVGALIEQMANAQKTNAAIAERVKKRSDYAEQIATTRAEAGADDIAAEDAETQAAALMATARLRRQDAEAKRLKATLMEEKLAEATKDKPIPAMIVVNDLAAQIAGAQKQNDAAKLALSKKALIDQALEQERLSAEMTAAIEARDAARLKAIADSEMPIEGVSFGDGIVLLNGHPFSQASDAERLRASIAIAMAMNPKLKVIRIREGSRLDSDAMKLVAALAEDRGYQVWCEVVESRRPTAIVIEDGGLASDHHAEAAE